MSERGDQTLRSVAPALFVLLWSTGFIGAKLGLPYAEPLGFLLLRFAIVIGLLLSAALLLRRRWPSGTVQILHLAAAGVMLHGGYLGGVFSAIHRGMSAGLVALIVGMQPLLTAVLGRAFLGERVSRVQWAGLVAGLAGVWMVISEKLSVAGLSATGIGLSLLALCSITAGTLYQKRFCGGMDLWTGSVVQFAAAALVMLPIATSIETLSIQWSPRFMVALAWLVLVLSLGAISLLHILIRQGAATRVAALFYLTPPATAVMSYAIFDERLGAVAVAGMAVTALGVWLVVRR